MEIYKTRTDQFTAELETIKNQSNTISLLRLTTILLLMAALFYYIKTSQLFLVYAAIGLLAVFLLLMRRHSRLSSQKQIKEALVAINTDETDYLHRKKIPFENGVEFNNFSHPYVFDLDIFGQDSLFQNLNRTVTFSGKKKLAECLQQLLPNKAILENQEAVKELSAKIAWRHDFMALGKISNDSRYKYENLLRWSRLVTAPVSKGSIYMAFITPALFVGLLVAYFVTDNPEFTKALSFLFVLNLAFLGKFIKRIKSEIQNADEVDKIIRQYGLIVEKIEKENFDAEKLKGLQRLLTFEDEKASTHLQKLSVLFSRMDSIDNFVTTLLFNGTFLFHIHVLNALIQWKKENGAALAKWLDVIGEFEMLSSVANFSFNNPGFAFPMLNDEKNVSFGNLSHPLLNPATRVGNDVNFQPQSFLILTGSNMSGKSTFLRSLGINMVLTGMGAPVCAEKANVHPMPVMVSMRLSDSLSDSESYFFAEIKRLKQIKDGLQKATAFVLLDEILRGTNSYDKRSGTIGVIKKMIAKNAVGAIATHDIEVCLTTDEYPKKLSNKCFEVEIIDNELHFDYKLRDGICRNKSATFLMKKMEII